MRKSSDALMVLALAVFMLLAGGLPARGAEDPFDGVAPNAPRTGSQAPSFSTKDVFGDTIALSEELKDHNVILLFYRGIF